MKAADPTAKVVGPTISGFLLAPDPKHPSLLDLPTFLQYSAANNLRFDGIVWHETARDYLNPYDWTAESVVTHIDTMRAMLAQYPQLGIVA